MHTLVSKLLLYSDLGEDSILLHLAEIYRDWAHDDAPKEVLIQRSFREVKRLLDLATEFGFDENLWHDYLTYLLITNENSFTLTCERVGASEGTVNRLAKNDLRVFRELFNFDFAPLEQDLGVDCFSTLCCYRAIPKKERRYNKHASDQIRRLSTELAAAADEEEMFRCVTEYYRSCGVGVFGFNRAFRIKRLGEEGVTFCPINNVDGVKLDRLVGYELQKRQLRDNTEAFLRGAPANNVLLYGDSGTGKSSSVKALINEYYDQGLRMIEIYKHQFRDLSDVIAQVKNRNYRFIIFIDDLSFEEDEVEYKFLKAVIEGGVETRPDNILIYATSNRRHLIRETWNDRSDMEHSQELHRSDTVEEKLSLSSRFGVQINYSSPNHQQFLEIVDRLAESQGITCGREELYAAANRWELRHGGLSGRTAQQFINDLAGRQEP
ncbi:MAG: ATP-binding protein [Oscillospiraceae bacterium]